MNVSINFLYQIIGKQVVEKEALLVQFEAMEAEIKEIKRKLPKEEANGDTVHGDMDRNG